MRSVFAACLFVAAACHAGAVRGGDGAPTAVATNRSITMRRGESTALVVDVDRPNFAGTVKVAISQLPNGVTTDHASLKVGLTAATFILGASASADLVRDRAIAITVQDPAGREAKQYVNLTVTE